MWNGLENVLKGEVNLNHVLSSLPCLCSEQGMALRELR